MIYSFIRDNHIHGTVGDFLKERVTAGDDLSVVSAYFAVFVYATLKDKLNEIAHLKFLLVRCSRADG